ncbi:hypothetical protein BDZ97DRAFT_1920646 [Flammula alnicola]|nr:hypothetical protein BDZ97DRAFT_1920646 [Flammula alnicola]
MYFAHICFLFVAAAVANAQTDNTNNVNPPPCVLNCLTTAAAQTGCVLTNTVCICSSTQFQSDSRDCLQANCTAEETQDAVSLQEQQCAAGATPISLIYQGIYSSRFWYHSRFVDVCEFGDSRFVSLYPLVSNSASASGSGSPGFFPTTTGSLKASAVATSPRTTVSPTSFVSPTSAPSPLASTRNAASTISSGGAMKVLGALLTGIFLV